MSTVCLSSNAAFFYSKMVTLLRGVNIQLCQNTLRSISSYTKLKPRQNLTFMVTERFLTDRFLQKVNVLIRQFPFVLSNCLLYVVPRL